MFCICANDCIILLVRLLGLKLVKGLMKSTVMLLKAGPLNWINTDHRFWDAEPL